MYHEEKGFDRKIRERGLCCREPAAGVSRQQGVQDNWSLSRRRNIRRCPVSVGCAGHSPLPEYTLSDVMSGRISCVKKSGTTENMDLRLFCTDRLSVWKGLFL